MLMKRCVQCGKLFPYASSSRCPSCKALYESTLQERQAQRSAKYNRTRDKEKIRFYKSKEWKRLRDWYAQKAGYKCEDCGALGTEVHHIVPIQTSKGWMRRLDPKNLRLLCTGCHNRTHKKSGLPDPRGHLLK